jgi:hypothetical protein
VPYVRSIQFDAGNPGVAFIIAGDYDDDQSTDCVHQTRNSGETWDKVCDGIPAGVHVYDIAIDPSNSNRLYAGTSSGVFQGDVVAE